MAFKQAVVSMVERMYRQRLLHEMDRRGYCNSAMVGTINDFIASPEKEWRNLELGMYRFRLNT
jgi:hypothetical protein